MKLSVCIPSYNPSLTLIGTVDSLICQKEFIDQLVIVIDNDKYPGYENTLKEKYSGLFSLTVVMQPNAGRASARNKCAELATGDVLLFLDDDFLTDCNLVQKHIEYHEKIKDCIAVGNGFRNHEQAKDDFSKYVAKVEELWQRNVPQKQEITLDKFVFTTCNMSIDKRTFDKLGRFDARLKDAEDFDLGVRALNAGVKIFYDRTLLAWPNDWPDVRTFINRHNAYIKGNAELLKLHPEYLQISPKLLPPKPSVIKKLLLSISRNTFCSLVINETPLFKVLPLSLKFIMYRLTLSANSLSNK